MMPALVSTRIIFSALKTRCSEFPDLIADSRPKFIRSLPSAPVCGDRQFRLNLSAVVLTREMTLFDAKNNVKITRRSGFYLQ
jgi:hypothetical protein